LDGGGGTNALNYSGYTTDVTVNLPLFAATGVGYYLINIQNVTGGAGNDILVGDDASNVLDGGPGRDLLIDGGSAYLLNPDTLLGGGGEDILIAGFTDYDYDAAALEAIRAEWSRTDLDYATRVLNLMSGDNGRLPALSDATVHSN